MSVNRNQHSFSLQHLRAITSSLERVVASFYGPQCSQTLLTSATGKAVVTSDGYTILQSINASHPLAHLIRNAIDHCHSLTYDGCKTFIVFLSQFISLSQLQILKGRFKPQGEKTNCSTSSSDRQAVLCMSRCLQKIIKGVMPCVYLRALYYCITSVLHNRSHRDILSCVVKTTLMPHLNPKLSEFLSGILVDAVSDFGDMENVQWSLEFLLKNFSCMCIRMPDQPYDRSQAIPCYIIQREFTLNCASDKINKPIKIILVTTTLDGSRGDLEPSEIFQIKYDSRISDSLICKIKNVTKFADDCVKLGINVIITSEGVPQFAIDIMRSRAISIVHYVLKEDITVLETLSGVLAISDIDSIEKSSIICAKDICPVSVCGRKCVQLQIDSKIKVRNLILCAPTIGLCDQLYLVAQKAVKSMELCLSRNMLLDCLRRNEEIDLESDKQMSQFSVKLRNNPPEMTSSKQDKNCHDEIYKEVWVIPGGGGFELLISYYLKEHTLEEKDSEVAIICNIISECLMHVLKLFHKNTSEDYGDKHAYINVEQYLQTLLKEGTLFGLNRRGKAMDVSLNGVFEPIVLKIHTLDCVLALLVQLLRIDDIVGVRRKVQD